MIALVATVSVACSPGGGSDTSASAAPIGSAPVWPPVAVAGDEAAAQLFVSPSGDDGAAGTQGAPLKTIGKAAQMAKPGTRISVADGSYQGAVTTRISGTAQARITFMSASRGGAKIVAADGDIAWHNTGDYVDVVGFDITGSTTDGLISGGSYDRLIANAVHGFRGGNCITVANDDYSLHDVDVVGNLAYGCGASELDHGIYVSQPGGSVVNNIAYGNAGFGIQCWHNCNSQVIANNLVFGNAAGGIVVGQGDAPNDGRVAADHMTVSNNIAVNNGRDGIRESGTTGPANRFLHNLLWQNGTKRINLQSGKADGTIMADPLFVDFKPDGSGDYRLRPESPGAGVGVPDGAPATDIDGHPRPTGGGVDLGPYES